MNKKPALNIEDLIVEAKHFCESQSKENHIELIGITDGRAVGTYIEHRFQNQLLNHYELTIGNSAKGIDLPDTAINTDIKATSIVQPQSGCPFKSARQKIFGLGYNLLLFVYDKKDAIGTCTLQFVHCAFIDKDHTADFTLTRRLREMLADGALKADIVSYIQDRNLPVDEIGCNELADEILNQPPAQGYLTISNALQWRLQYTRILSLNNSVDGVVNYDWQS